MPIQARRFLRRMRGGAQAHLLEADDGRHYVVKFLENPQHRRILVNEWIATGLLKYLGISCPDVRLIDVTAPFLADNPEIGIQLGNSRRAVLPGWHFGSAFPGDPIRLAIYDFIPDSLLPKIANRQDFLGALVFDKWCANADARQAIFYRAKLGDSLKVGFVCQMIDHGYILNGPHWEFIDSPLQGLYFRHEVYTDVTSMDVFARWLQLVEHFPEEVIDETYRAIPESWLPGDERTRLEDLLARLLRRRQRVADLVEACTTGRVNPFPNWGKSKSSAAWR
jgi:hypothetical protein